MQRRYGLVTCLRPPEPDPDEALLRDALGDAEVFAWDDPAADPGAYDVCVIRSTWNYAQHVDAFRAWVERAAAATTLRNPAPAVLGNLHKRYLVELEARGVPIVPTAIFPRGAPADLAATAAARGWTKAIVVKPAISAGSWRTRRFDDARDPEAQAHLEALLAERDAMAQPYLAGVEDVGERDLVWIDGAFTHAIRKRARFDGDDEQVATTPLSHAERALGTHVLAAAGPPAPLLYARVDLMPDDAGRFVLSELELIEPSLFLAQSPAALDRLVAALARPESS